MVISRLKKLAGIFLLSSLTAGDLGDDLHNFLLGQPALIQVRSGSNPNSTAPSGRWKNDASITNPCALLV